MATSYFSFIKSDGLCWLYGMIFLSLIVSSSIASALANNISPVNILIVIVVVIVIIIVIIR